MFPWKSTRAAGIAALFCLCAASAPAQRVRGELHLEVHDPQGTVVSPTGELVSEANGFRRTLLRGRRDVTFAQDLPFGVYRLSLQAEGFAPWSDLVEIRSEVPLRVAVTLGVAPLTTRVEVNDSAMLVDPYSTGIAVLHRAANDSRSMTRRNRARVAGLGVRTTGMGV